MVAVLTNLLLIFLMMAGTALAAPTPTLNLGSGTGTPGAVVTIPVTLTNISGTAVSAIGIDIGFDTTSLEIPTAALGPAGNTAGKTIVESTPSPGIARIGVFGLTDARPIPNGVVVNISFTIKPTARLGNITLTNFPSASDAAGVPVSISGSPCVLTITAVHFVQIPGNSTAYTTLQDAYGAAPDGSHLRVRNMTSSESFILNRDIDIFIDGGYKADFTGVSGYSVLDGDLTIGYGSLVVSNLVIQ